MFQRFGSLTRFSHDWTITEKIDGTNQNAKRNTEHGILLLKRDVIIKITIPVDDSNK